MIDPTLEIRRYYVELLAGISATVGNIFPATQAPPFVVISTRANESGTKNTFDFTVTSTFDIVCKTSGDWGGDKLAEDIANEIMPLLIGTRGYYGRTENFQIVTCTVEASDPFLELIGTGKVVRKILQVQNYVSLISGVQLLTDDDLQLLTDTDKKLKT